jgi:DNA-directed RNA polymerase beta subunit
MPSVLSQSVVAPLRGIPRDGDGDGLIHDGTPHEQSVPASPALPARAPARMRPIVDAPAVRRGIYERVQRAAAAIPPLTNQRHTLALTDVGYEGPLEFPKSAWKRAILGGRSLGARLRGTWTLSDNATGRVVDRRRTTVATVPYVTDHGTFIQNGSEYTLGHQLRLRPGVFARRQANGELEAHVNVMPGQGLSHRIYLEPATGIFRLRVGQANMALLPLLRALGANDHQLRETWGDQLYQSNQLRDDPSVVGKLHTRLVRKPAADKTAEQEVREAFERMPLDPEVTRRTLGKPHDRVDRDTLLDATRKLIAINRGEAEPDDRDHLAYMTIHGPEDLLAERVGRDRMLLGKVLWKASMAGNLASVQPDLLTRGIQAAIMSSGLGQPTECYSDDTWVLTRRGFVRWPDVKPDDEFACQIDDKVEYHRADKIYKRHYRGIMLGCHTEQFDYLVTPNHRNYAHSKPRSVFRFEEAATSHGRRRWFLSALGRLASPVDAATISLTGARHDKYRRPLEPLSVGTHDWCRFLGWWIAEGSAMRGYKGREWRVTIAQSWSVNPDKCAEIAQLLDRLPFGWRYSRKGREFVIRNKQLCLELMKYGTSARTKRIPRYIFELPEPALSAFFETYFKGDGCRDGEFKKSYTVSYGLAADLIELWGRLGGSATIGVVANFVRTEGRKVDGYVNGFSETREKYVTSSVDAIRSGKPDPYFTVDYTGYVYCASVPGGLLYVMRNGRAHWSGNSINPAMIFDQQARVSRLGEGGIPNLESVPAEARNVQPSHFGFVDPLVTPESLKVGVDSRLTQAARKGEDGRLYAPFRDVRTGRTEWKTAQDLADAVVAFPGELRKLEPYVNALVGGQARPVPRNRVQYELVNNEDSFSAVSNLVPIKSTVKGQREVMAGRMITQALPVIDPEAPLVQAGVPGSQGDSYEAQYGPHFGALRSDVDGVVVSVSPDEVVLRGGDGRKRSLQLYNNYPYNRKTYIHQTPVVRPGDHVRAGALLARSNYTDNQGVAALGKNARVAYVPFRGLNFEDAIVVSDSFAKRLTSEHMYQHSLDLEEGMQTGKRAHLSTFPGKFSRAVLDTVDDDGAVRPGTTVNYGDPLVLAIKQRDRTHGSIHRGRDASWVDRSETWGHHSPGLVTDVEKTARGIVVSVKSTNPTEVGDKISGRYGDKGVIAAVIPDHEMPADGQGRPFEVLLNPLGIVSRTNPAQEIEAALGKIAERTGKPYRVVDFDDRVDYNEWTIQELARHGMKSKEAIHDPVGMRDIPNVLTGNRWFMKLHHTAESKAQGRGTVGYTAEGRPSRGGEGGSKRVSLMDINAILSHGATEVLRDAGAIRGQQHPELWAQVMAGHAIPTPRTPIVWDKFLAQLKAAGINVVKDGTRLNIMALSGRDVDELAGDREIRHADTVDWKSGLKPIRGGLFDEQLTGGHNGNRWSFIRLPEALPNPVMEEPIRRMLGLTEKKFLDVLAGREKFNDLTGPGAIHHALDRIDVTQAINQARADIRAGRKGVRDAAVRRLGYLKAAQKTGVHPRDWMLDKVPVLPPIFRPVSVMGGSQLPMVADANYLYKEVLEAADNFRAMQGVAEDLSDERLAMYGAFKGVVGLGDPLHPKNQERQVKGVLRHIFGGSSKSGVVQRKLLSSSADLVGRSVIVPDPGLDMDQVGLPETRAWDVYRPFVVRRLRRRGMPAADALRAVEDRTPLARSMLVEEMGERPVIVNRAPVLHRYGMMAFRPTLTAGDTLRVPPLIVTGFGADFDGDTMQYHVPALEGAVQDAYDKMLPSRNLLAVASFRAHQLPSKEYAGGLYVATTARANRRPRVFATRADALAAYRRGEVGPDHPVEIAGDS